MKPKRNRWEDLGYRRRGYIAPNGEVLAVITGHFDGTWQALSNVYIDRESAERHVEAKYGR